MVEKCPADNTQSVEQDNFWTDVRSGNLDAHHIGWIICGAAAVVTVLLSFITILGHARNYNRPLEQRQIIRVLLLAPVYAIVSFFSYRFFRSYTYFSLAETAYEAFAIAAFLILMLQYIGDSVEDQRAVFMGKDKKPLPFPFCCWRFRPAKPYFLVVIKFSVVQYVVISPALTIAGIVLEYYELLCESSLSYKYGHVYILGVDFVSISVALYGLIVLYALIKKDLEGKKPLAKFMTIKMAIFFIFYQTFVFDLLQDRGVIKATEYWTATNVSDGLNALCITLEMVIIAAFQMWAFNWKEYHLDRIADRRQAFRGNALSKKGKTPTLKLGILIAITRRMKVLDRASRTILTAQETG
ncbi:Predicted seven transmembrane receptor-rhodopsin family [Ceraceosorus bombacis]|uniref:Predicted seven transmembrane receptor-rhodopsin family n=1 Tax=Ceraceosorus bombacis TaxID=401625 RepID=A0A0P1BJG4_9BASI|nr:Predicted seven transmembrane receptor-rhodopsin family [Ceraceosorus bombacis]